LYFKQLGSGFELWDLKTLYYQTKIPRVQWGSVSGCRKERYRWVQGFTLQFSKIL